jgi:hypothetical protein
LAKRRSLIGEAPRPSKRASAFDKSAAALKNCLRREGGA